MEGVEKLVGNTMGRKEASRAKPGNRDYATLSKLKCQRKSSAFKGGEFQGTI